MKWLNDLFVFLFNVSLKCFVVFGKSGDKSLMCSSLENFYHSNFNLSGVKVLDIMGPNLNKLGTWKSDIFINNEEIEQINIQQSLDTIEPGAFAGLRQDLIYEIYLSDNKIPIIEGNTFNISGNFSLSLPKNNIQKIKPGAFGNIQRINLEKNKISKIEKGVFSNLDIVYLNLEINNIEYIEDGAFFGMEKLKFLSLENNRLRHFDLQTLFGEPINLKVLHLSGNHLHDIKSDMFELAPKLTLLSLSNNSITDIPKTTFQKLQLLEFLELKDNNLLHFDQNLFPRNSHLKFLYLNNNNLTGLSSKFLRNFNSLKKLAIYNNPLKCSRKTDLDNWAKEHNAQLFCWSFVKCREDFESGTFLNLIDECFEAELEQFSSYAFYNRAIFEP